MASPVAVPLSLNTAPTTKFDLIESEDTIWGDEDADLELNIKIPINNDVPHEHASQPDTPEEEQDFGAPLSQHQPSLQWEDTAFNKGNQEEDGFVKVLPNSESQGTDWDDASSEDEDEEDEEGALLWEVEEETAAAAAAAAAGAAAAGAKELKKPVGNAKLMPLDEMKKDFLSKLVTEAFSTSMFKNTAANAVPKETQNSDLFNNKRQRTSASESSLPPRAPLKRHVCPASSSNGTCCSPYMNPTCNFTHKTNNILGKHIHVTCSQCKKPITTLRVNDIIKLEGTLGLIRSITRPTVNIGGGQQEKLLTLHLQLLSEELVLHTNCPTGTVTLPILKQSLDENSGGSGSGSGSTNSRSAPEPLRDTVMLKTKCQHQNITINELNHTWVRGRVDWLPQTSSSYPNIMYCDSNKTCDVKSVEMTLTGAGSAHGNFASTACAQWPCSCLNPWEPKPLVLRPGDFVELKQAPGEHDVDSYTRLARVVQVIKDEKKISSSGAAAGGPNILEGKENVVEEDQVNAFFSKPRTCFIDAQVFSRRIETAEPTITHDFTLCKGLITRVPLKNVLRKIDHRFDLPPGVRLLDSNGADILKTQSVAGGAAGGGDGSNSASASAPTNHPTEVPASDSSPMPPPLECIDLFCGMGGLSIGLEISGVAEVKVGVDGFRSATETFQQAHPNATVACDDVCRFLMKNGARLERRASGQGSRSGNGSSKVDDADDKNNQDQRPKMRLLVGGPPCQGFSGANKSNSAQKLEKNVCMAIFAEAVSRLRPDFVIIENVKGLLRAPNGVLDSVILCLVSLGYQTRVRVVNAGSYGVAQHRVRVIILAAKHGLPLPEIPRPSHIFHAGGYAREEPCRMDLRQRCAYAGVPVAWQQCVIVPTCALLPREDIKSIIGDLPLDDVEIGPVEYKSEPKTVFQANARRGVTSNKAYDHRTNSWTTSDETGQRIKAIPKESDFVVVDGATLRKRFEGRVFACEHPQLPVISGDWLDLPFHLLPEELRAAIARTLFKNRGRFGRLMWISHCSTVLTHSCLQINSDTCGPVIHPEADRVLTVREIARVQGIPDKVRIHGSVVESYRQCGNGVPSPLAEAIGREIRKAVSQVYRDFARV